MKRDGGGHGDENADGHALSHIMRIAGKILYPCSAAFDFLSDFHAVKLFSADECDSYLIIQLFVLRASAIKN